MASRSAQTKTTPVQMKLKDGLLFSCPCGSNEFKATEDDAPLHLFCRCGQVYTTKDLPPLLEEE